MIFIKQMIGVVAVVSLLFKNPGATLHFQPIDHSQDEELKKKLEDLQHRLKRLEPPAPTRKEVLRMVNTIHFLQRYQVKWLCNYNSFWEGTAMLKYIVLPLVFVVCFFVIQSGIQIGHAIYLTENHVPDLIDAYETSNGEPLQSTAEFGSSPSPFGFYPFIVWLISLGLSSVIIFGVNRYCFSHVRTAR